MRVAILCEYSGIVRDAFINRGHKAISVDLLDSEAPGPHCKSDVFDFLDCREFDLIIAHPPCTYLAVSGNRWYANSQEREASIEWTNKLWKECVKRSARVCFENPVGVLSTRSDLPKPQYIQPWQFGHKETKKTALFLYNLTTLKETDNVYEDMMTLPAKERHRIHYLGGGRGHERSKTYTGIAKAMASQWG